MDKEFFFNKKEVECRITGIYCENVDCHTCPIPLIFADEAKQFIVKLKSKIDES